MTEEKFEQLIKFYPAFDKRSEGKGIGSVSLYFVLKGPLGAVVFSTGTDWFLPETDGWMNSFPHNFERDKKWRPRGSAVCYCSPIPLSDYQESNEPRENCDWLGVPCYGDCSYTASTKAIDILVTKGSDGLFEYLEEFYNDNLVRLNQELKLKQSNEIYNEGR